MLGKFSLTMFKKKEYQKIVVICILIIITANPVLLASSNPPPGRWEKVAKIIPGEKIIIYKKDGVIQECRYKSMNGEFVTCVNKDDKEIKINLSLIDRVIIPKAGKYAKNGLLWGAMGGAGVGAGFVFGFDVTNTTHQLWGIGVMSAIGALGGGLIGAAVGTPGETVYISEEAALVK